MNLKSFLSSVNAGKLAEFIMVMVISGFAVMSTTHASENYSRKARIDLLTHAGVEILIPGSEGSGFFLTHDGLVVTAAHVVEEAKVAQVVSNGVPYLGEVAYVDKRRDIAFIKVDLPPSAHIETLDLASEAGTDGDKIYSVNNPYAVSNVYMEGYVANNDFQPDVNNLGGVFTMIHMPIQPGSSGGAVVNEDNKVIGIVEGILTNWGIGLIIKDTTIADDLRLYRSGSQK